MKNKKTWIIVGAVVVAVAILGVAGWTWHKQPSFCSTMCHRVMATYVDSLSQNDKLASAHAKAGLKCLDCHEPTVAEQVSEVGKFVTGNYTIPLPESRIGTKEFCLKCHDPYEKLAGKTATLEPPYNPHESHYGELDCYQCHRMHDTSKYFCTSCHQGLKLPSGWEAAPMQ